MTFRPVVIDLGSADLGEWGRLELTGASSALLRLTHCEDLEFRGEPAETLTSDDIFLNETLGRLILLPRVGATIARFDLSYGVRSAPDLTLSRDPDPGLRTSGVKVINGLGLVYRSEGDLIMFDEQGDVVWHVSADFERWGIAQVSDTTVTLVSTEWPPSGKQQTRSLATGQRV